MIASEHVFLKADRETARESSKEILHLDTQMILKLLYPYVVFLVLFREQHQQRVVTELLECETEQ